MKNLVTAWLTRKVFCDGCEVGIGGVLIKNGYEAGWAEGSTLGCGDGTSEGNTVGCGWPPIWLIGWKRIWL